MAKVQLICEHCGDTFERFPSQAGRFCKKECADAARRFSHERLHDAEWLRQQYWEVGRSTEDIAEELGCSRGTVLRWMRKHQIVLRTKTECALRQDTDPRLRDAAWLNEQYWENGLTLSRIAKIIGCSKDRVRQACDRLKVNRRDGRSAQLNRNEPAPRMDCAELDSPTWLHQRHWDDGATVQEIADELGVCKKTVLNRMNEHDIPRKSYSQARRGRVHSPIFKRLDWVREQYVGEGRSMRDIAQEAGCMEATVRKAIEAAGVVPRSAGRANKGGRSVCAICSYCGEWVHKPVTFSQLYTHEYYFGDHTHCRGAWLAERSGEDSPNWIPRVTVPCSWCRADVERPEWRVAAQQRHFCAGTDCWKNWIAANRRGENSSAWKGEAVAYSSRERWYKRDGGTEWTHTIRSHAGWRCERCGRKDQPVHAHHHWGWTNFPQWRSELWNGICLCEDCHMHLHSLAGYAERWALAWEAFERHQREALDLVPLALPAVA